MRIIVTSSLKFAFSRILVIRRYKIYEYSTETFIYLYFLFIIVIIIINIYTFYFYVCTVKVSYANVVYASSAFPDVPT